MLALVGKKLSLCVWQLVPLAVVFAVLSLNCSNASAGEIAEEMRSVLQSAFPEAQLQVDPDGQGGAVALGQTLARWRFGDFRHTGNPIKCFEGAGAEVNIVKFYKFVPPYGKDENRKYSSPLAALLVCRNSAEEWKWAKLEEHAGLLDDTLAEVSDFIGIGRLQVKITLEATYPERAGKAIYARRFLLFDLETLQLLFAGSEYARASTETHQEIYENIFAFDDSTTGERGIHVKHKGVEESVYTVPWKESSYTYVDDMPWLGEFDKPLINGFEPYEKTVAIKLPDGKPAFGALYRITRTLLNTDQVDRVEGIVGVDGVVKFVPGAKTELAIWLNAYYDAKYTFGPEYNAEYEEIQLELAHPAISACIRRFTTIFKTYEDISDVGFAACSPVKSMWDAEFSAASQDADFIFIIRKEKTESLSALGTPTPNIEYELQVTGQYGWEVQHAPWYPYEEQGLRLRVAPEGGYTKSLAIEDPEKANLFVHNVKDGRYGKIFNINCSVITNDTGLGLRLEAYTVIQSEPQNTPSLRSVNPRR